MEPKMLRRIVNAILEIYVHRVDREIERYVRRYHKTCVHP
jgi:hypothetical protein